MKQKVGHIVLVEIWKMADVDLCVVELSKVLSDFCR